MAFLWRVREVLRRCLSQKRIACGVSQDTCPMIMFMKIMTGLENSRVLNFKLYFHSWKRSGRSGQHVRNVFMIRKVFLYAFCTFLLSPLSCLAGTIIAPISTSLPNINQLTVTQCSGRNWVITKHARQPNTAVIKTYRNTGFSGL